MSAGAIALVLLALALVDGRVRTQIAQRIVSQPGVTIASGGMQLHDAAAVVVIAVRDQSLAHASLASFALAGAVLVLFMLRT